MGSRIPDFQADFKMLSEEHFSDHPDGGVSLEVRYHRPGAEEDKVVRVARSDAVLFVAYRAKKGGDGDLGGPIGAFGSERDIVMMSVYLIALLAKRDLLPPTIRIACKDPGVSNALQRGVIDHITDAFKELEKRGDDDTTTGGDDDAGD